MRKLLTIILLATVTVTQAQTTLTLEQCIDEALNNNIAMRNADRSIAKATEQRREAFTNYFPTVTASGGGFISDEAFMQLSLAPGMEMSMLKNGMMGGIVAMQPVFVGGQIVNGNRLARLGEDVGKLQRNLSSNEVQLQTETYFWQIVMLKEKLVTLDRLTLQLDRADRDAQAAVDAGVANRNDLLQVQLKRNEVAVARINAENNLSLLRSLLAQYIGRSGGTIDVAFAMTDELPASPESLYVPAETAVLQTPELRLLDKQVEAGRLQYKMAVGKQMPTVAVGGGYVYNDLMDRSQTNLVGMVTVSIPLTAWWGGSHNMKQKKIDIEQAESERVDKEQLLTIRIQKSWNDVTDAYRQLQIAKESIAQSEENLRLNTDYYEAGTCSMSDLLDAQTLYQQSRDNYVEAYTGYEIRCREYLQATAR